MLKNSPLPEVPTDVQPNLHRFAAPSLRVRIRNFPALVPRRKRIFPRDATDIHAPFHGTNIYFRTESIQRECSIAIGKIAAFQKHSRLATRDSDLKNRELDTRRYLRLRTTLRRIFISERNGLFNESLSR